MKTVNDIAKDLSTLYDDLRSGVIDLKHAAELANIAGKILKAAQLELAKEALFANLQTRPRLAFFKADLANQG